MNVGTYPRVGVIMGIPIMTMFMNTQASHFGVHFGSVSG